MAFVEEIARAVIAAIGSDASYLLASKWVVDRYRQIFAQTRARHLRQIAELYAPAPIKDGAATFTRDSRTVTGDATARAAWVGELAGRWVRGKVTWYQIDTLEQDSSGNKQLRLRTKFAEDTQTAAAYHIVQRFNALDEDARWIGDTMVNMRRRIPMQKVAIEELDVTAPARDRVGPAPQVFSEAQDMIVDGKIRKTVEIYPYPDTSEVFHYVKYPTIPMLRLHDQLPPEIDEHVLREGAIADVMRYEMARAIKAGQVEQAATWRNEYRAQETAWKKTLMDAVRADRAVDDMMFIVQRAGWGPQDRDIRTAYDEILARWPR